MLCFFSQLVYIHKWVNLGSESLFFEFITCYKQTAQQCLEKTEAGSNVYEKTEAGSFRGRKGRRQTRRDRERQTEEEKQRTGKQNPSSELKINNSWLLERYEWNRSLNTTSPALLRFCLLRDTAKWASISIQPHKLLFLWLTMKKLHFSFYGRN